MTNLVFGSIVLSITTMMLPRYSKCHVGKAFYFAPMPLYSDRDDPYILKVVSDVAGSIKVVAPGLGINITHPLVPEMTEISLGDLLVSADGIDDKGIQIFSSVNVTIYVIKGLYWGGYGKITSLMPVTDSATAFVVQSYLTDWDTRKSHFIVVGTEDFTEVYITLKTATGGNITFGNVEYGDGDVIRITLNWLQTFYAYLYANDLSGSVIESNKPVVVLSGADCVDIPKDVSGGCNIIESQMIPVRQWGNDLIVPPLYPASRSPVRVYAIHNYTQVNITYKDAGNSVSASFALTLNRGEFWERTDTSPLTKPVVISSDKMVSVVLYGASKGESDGQKSNPFMLVVPEIRQYPTTTATFPTLQYGDLLKKERPFENYAVIVLKKYNAHELQYNAHELEIVQNYTALVSDDEYAVVITQLDNVTQHTVSVVNNSTPIPMAVFVYGMARFESYGFVAGFNFINTGTDCSNLDAPLNGSLSSTTVQNGDFLTVSCNQGYTLTGDTTLVCLSGSISAKIGTCEADCNGLVKPVHGSLSSVNISHGNHVTISCNPGYTLEGDGTLVCLSGFLTGPIGTCEADCRGLITPTNGLLSSKVASHGNHVTISCNHGYKLSGERTLVCSSGSWSGSEGTCEVEKGDTDPITESKNDSTSIILGVVLGLIIIVLLGIVIVLCVRNKRTSIKDKSAWASPPISTLGQNRLNENRTGNNQGVSSLVNGASESTSPNGRLRSSSPNGIPERSSAYGRPESGSYNGDSTINSVKSGPYARLATGGQENATYATISEEPYYLAPISSNSHR